LVAAESSQAGLARSDTRRVKGRRLSSRACTRCAPEIGAGPARVSNRRKASRTRESTVLQWGGGKSGLGRLDRCSARSSAGRRPGGDEASDTSPRLPARRREHSVRRLDPLAEVGPTPLKRRARRRDRFSLENAAVDCRVHGCSSLTMWVASVGRTRPGSLFSRTVRKDCGGASQLEESRGTFDWGVAERDE
jgi:hypothetical protein